MHADPLHPELTTRQLDRYAEDFGALFAEYQDVKMRFDQALREGHRANEIQHALEALLRDMEDLCLVITDGDGVIREISPAAARLLGVTANSCTGRPFAQLVAEEDRYTVGDLILDAVGGKPSSPAKLNAPDTPIEANLRQTEGLSLTARIVRVPCADASYRLHWLLRAADSSTADNEARAALFSRLYARSANGIMVTDTKGRILSINPAFTAITGYDDAEIVGGTPQLLASGHHDEMFYQRMWKSLADNGEWQGEIWNRRKNGEIYPEWLHILAVRDEEGETTQYIGMFSDVSHHHDAQNRIYELANYDPLTSLPNRALCKDRLQQAIVQARRNDSRVGLLFVDLDRFKGINDTLGHAVGDQLLIDFSWRVVHAIRDSDTAARLGGDEFVVIVPNLAHEEDIRIVADKIIGSLTEPFLIEGHELYVGASVGAAAYPTHGDSAEALLKHADAAMYAAKGEGGNACRFFDDALGRSRVVRLEMETGLRRALAQGQLRLAYQPQVTASGGHIVGVEALLRWDWPGHGNIPPDQFIPLAEETGLILPIGDWVLRAACLQLAAWRRDGLPPLRMAINITARQLNDPDFAQRVIAILDETGASPGNLEVEITESQMMEKLHVGLENLSRLRALGVAVAIDDFGTGYSSLGRIRHLPIDRIKIDKSFIADLERNADSYAIAHAILAMVNALHLEAIAEGVESHEQAHLLAGIDCHEFQGFLFGKPQPPEAIAALLKTTGGLPC